MNQFIPDIIKQQTKLTTYNCGFGGQGLKFSYIQLSETLKRYKPKMVIVDISPNILLDPKSEQKLKILFPFYNRDTLIYNELTNNKSLEKIKLSSSIYPYNSTIGSIIKGMFKNFSDSLNGFAPINRIIDTTNLTNQLNTEYFESKIPSQKFAYLNNLIKLCQCRNIKMVIVVSPYYKMNHNLEMMIDQIKSI